MDLYIGWLCPELATTTTTTVREGGGSRRSRARGGGSQGISGWEIEKSPPPLLFVSGGNPVRTDVVMASGRDDKTNLDTD